MRRSLVAIALLASTSLVACEDGPNDRPFTPSPANAQWNNGRSDGTPPPAGTTDSATQGFQVQTGGTNRQELCTGDQKATRWAAMVKEPIIPPTTAGGLDLSGGPTWKGITIEEAEKINCQSASLGDAFGDGTLVNYWGDNGEVWLQYRVSDHKGLQVTVFPGYVGTMNFKSADNAHSYIIQIYSQVQLDGQPLTLDWVGAKTDPAKFKVFDDMYRALVATYASADSDPTPCNQTGRCIKGDFGDVAYFYVPALGWALWIDNQNAQQPNPSIPTRIDQSPAKVLPYSFANPLLKLDKEGPVGLNTSNLGNAANPCVLKMGLDFGDFLSDCVMVNNDPTKDAIEKNKLLGGLSHNTERFSFDVQGVDVNFTDNRLEPTQIVTDTDMPSNGDTSTSFDVDQSTLGKLLNDFDSSGKRDLHGSGAVYKEYARLVRSTLLSLSGIPDGNIKKCVFPSPLPPDFDPNQFMANLPAYCTGFEGMLTAAAPTQPIDMMHGVAADPVNLGLLVTAVDPSYKLGLKLGHQKVVFCADANGDLNNGYANCGAPYGAEGDIFQTSYQRVLKVFAKNEVTNLPVDAQDIRFYFKMYTMALLKHLMVAGLSNPPDLSMVTTAPNPADAAAPWLDLDNLFFDSEGAGQFELAEYVDRRFASQTQNPTDFVFVADVKDGIMDDYSFSRDLFRGEEAIYQTVLENPADGLGQEDSAILSNVFGSPLLKALYPSDLDAQHTAYYCATNLDDTCAQNGMVPPLDLNGNVLLAEDGRPLLARYPGALGSAATPFALGQSHLKVVQTFQNIQSALVSVPATSNPYDPTSAPATPIQKLIPWSPQQPGVGFPVALSGTLDKFIETAQLDFSGTTISANVDYLPYTDMNDGKQYVNILAVETTDFLGDVFLCAAPNPNNPAVTDLLRARMYSPVKGIVDWIAQHPGAADSCGLVVRYSPFDNYVDYITSLTYGVRLNATQGGGFGRIVDVTIFVPGQ